MTTQILGKEAISTLRGTTPSSRFREVDQTAPAGMWQVDVSGDQMQFQRATAADWSAFTDVVTLSSTPAVTIHGTINFAGDVTVDDDIAVIWGTGSDFYTAYSASNDAWEVGTGSTVASNVFMSMATSGSVTMSAALTVTGDITAAAAADISLLVHSTSALVAGIELRRGTSGDGNYDWFWEASGGELLASYLGTGSKTLAWKLKTNGDASFEGNDALNIGAAGNDFGASTLDLASGYTIAGAGGLTISSASGNFDLTSAGDTIRLRLGDPLQDKVILAASGLRMTADSAHADTAGTNVLSIFNGTAPVGTLANGASIYCSGGVMKVINADGSGGTIDFTP